MFPPSNWWIFSGNRLVIIACLHNCRERPKYKLGVITLVWTLSAVTCPPQPPIPSRFVCRTVADVPSVIRLPVAAVTSARPRNFPQLTSTDKYICVVYPNSPGPQPFVMSRPAPAAPIDPTHGFKMVVDTNRAFNSFMQNPSSNPNTGTRVIAPVPITVHQLANVSTYIENLRDSQLLCNVDLETYFGFCRIYVVGRHAIHVRLIARGSGYLRQYAGPENTAARPLLSILSEYH